MVKHPTLEMTENGFKKNIVKVVVIMIMQKVNETNDACMVFKEINGMFFQSMF